MGSTSIYQATVVNAVTDVDTATTLQLAVSTANRRLAASKLSTDPKSIDAAEPMIGNYLAGRPSELGRAFFRVELARLLANRAHHVQRASLTSLPRVTVRTEPLILIVGLPRTGSTFLHHLLTKGIGWKAPTGAQLYDLDPTLPQQRYYRDARLRGHLAEHRSPGVSSAHPFAIRSAEECTPGLANHFAGIIPLAQWNDTSAPIGGHRYMAALNAYVMDLFALGVFGTSVTPVVLKSPGHTLDVASAIQTLKPDLAIWLTRDHRAVLQSWNGLVSKAKHLFGLTHTRSSQHAWRAIWLEADSANNRKNLSTPHLVVPFDRLVNHPVAVCLEIAQIGQWQARPKRVERAAQLLNRYQHTR
jgi:hypothetical protein